MIDGPVITNYIKIIMYEKLKIGQFHIVSRRNMRKIWKTENIIQYI